MSSDDEKRADKITLFIAELVRKRLDFSEKNNYVCPVCANVLQVQAGGYKRGDIKMLGVVVECGECDVTMALDFGIDE